MHRNINVSSLNTHSQQPPFLPAFPRTGRKYDSFRERATDQPVQRPLQHLRLGLSAVHQVTHYTQTLCHYPTRPRVTLDPTTSRQKPDGRPPLNPQGWLSGREPDRRQPRGGVRRLLEPVPRRPGRVQGVPLRPEKALPHLPSSVRLHAGEEDLRPANLQTGHVR